MHKIQKLTFKLRMFWSWLKIFQDCTNWAFCIQITVTIVLASLVLITIVTVPLTTNSSYIPISAFIICSILQMMKAVRVGNVLILLHDQQSHLTRLDLTVPALHHFAVLTVKYTYTESQIWALWLSMHCSIVECENSPSLRLSVYVTADWISYSCNSFL